MAAKQAHALSAGASVSATLVAAIGPKSHVTGASTTPTSVPEVFDNRLAPRGDVDRAREEQAVEVDEGPGRPGHEPDLLRRVAAPARQRRRRMPRPDVPPQHDGGHGEAGEGDGMEGDGAQAPPRRPWSARRRGKARQRIPASRRDRRRSLRAGSRARRAPGASTRPSARHWRRAYRRARGRGAMRAVRMIVAVPDDRQLHRGRGRTARPLRGVGAVPPGLAGGGPGGGRRGGPRACRAPRATRGSSGSGTPIRSTSRWPSGPGRWRVLEAASGRRLLHVTGQVTFGDAATARRHRPRAGPVGHRRTAPAGRGRPSLPRDRPRRGRCSRTRFGCAGGRRVPARAV